MGFSVFIAHARSIKRVMVGTNILETKLIAVRFKVSFNHACVLARIVSLKPCNKLHKLFCLLLPLYYSDKVRQSQLSPFWSTAINWVSRRQANLCFHFAGSGENFPDIGDVSMNNKELSSFLQILMKQNSFLL